jgi:hypothetical protein
VFASDFVDSNPVDTFLKVRAEAPSSSALRHCDTCTQTRGRCARARTDRAHFPATLRQPFRMYGWSDVLMWRRHKRPSAVPRALRRGRRWNRPRVAAQQRLIQ